MSGIEAAGLILGLWPVVSSLVTTYRDARAGESLAKLAKEIRVHEEIYKGWLRSLLQGHDQLTDMQIQALMEPGADGAWQQPEIQKRLQEALPPDTCKSIGYILSEIHEAMKVIEKALKKGEVDVPAAPSTRVVFRSRIRGTFNHARVMIPQSQFQQAHARLQKNVDNLERLTRSHEASIRYPKPRMHYGRGRRASDTRRKPMPKKHTNTFYKALEAGLQKCNCHDGHDTSLRVHCEDFFHVVLGVDGSETDPTELLLRPRTTFDTGITTLGGGEMATSDDESPGNEPQSPLMPLTEEPTETMASIIEASLWSPRSRNFSMSSTSQSKHAVQFQFSTDNPTATGRIPRPALDLELCMVSKDVSSTQSSVAQSPEPLQSFGTIRLGETVFTARGRPKMLPGVVECLEDRIQGLGNSKRKRDEIAQSLAFAVIQFSSTHWIDSSWTWRSFSVRDDDATGLQQLFVTRRIVPERPTSSPLVVVKQTKFWRLLTLEPILVRLGFALIELALAKRLSKLRAEGFGSELLADIVEGEASEDEKDYLTARAVMDSRELKESCSRGYQGVVEACLTCQVAMESSYLSLTSRAASFQDDVDTHVVQPLRHYFENNWGTGRL